MKNYSHLKEIELHPELLHPVLRQIAREHGAELRWQYVGGNEDGMTLFVSPAAVFPVRWNGTEYEPAQRADMKMRRDNPRLFQLLLNAIHARLGW